MPDPRLPPTARTEDLLSENSRFQVSGTTYPDDLLSYDYGGNYVMFRINVHQDSYLKKGAAEGDFIPADRLDTQKRGEVAGMSAASITAATAVGSGLVAGAAGSQVATSLGIPTSTVANTAMGVAGAAAVVTALGGNVQKQYVTQRQAICLYMPNDLSIKYGVSWEETSLGGTAAIVAGAENLGAAALKVGAGMGAGALLSRVFGLRGAGARALTAAGAAVGGLAAANNAGGLSDIAAAQALKAPGVGELASKASGTAANPKKEQIFKQVDFRTFTFSYQFFPRSSDEARCVRDIIKQFKLHMHPEFRDETQFLYIYPSEFEIIYYTNGQENLNLHRHTSCVLTDMNVSYAPQGIYTSFPDGMPTQINMQLTFKELAILTKKDIDAGY